MKRLHKFILNSFAGPFFLTFFIVIFLLLMQFLWKYIDDLAGKGLKFEILSELMFYVAASLVPLALPLAVLLASLMTMGNLGENFELTALKASGISLQRILAPLIGLSIFLTIGAFLFGNYILPITNLKMGTLLYDITNQRPELQIREGIFYNGIDGYSIRIGRKNYDTNLLYNLKIYDHTDNAGNTKVTVADSGYMHITEDKKFLILTLYNGYNYIEMENQRRPQRYNEKTYPMRRDKFGREDVRIALVGFGLNRSDENLFRQNFRMLSLRQLSHQADSMQIELDKKAGFLYNSLIHANILRYQPTYIQRDNRRRPGDKMLEKGPVHLENFDSLFNAVPTYQMSSIVNEALSYARDSKTYISSSAINYDDLARRMRRYIVEWWNKYTYAFSCLIFFFIGAPLGAIVRKGGLGMPVVISVLFFVIWYIISLSGEKMVREGILPPVIGMWISAYILLPAGIFLTRKAALDSTMLNVDTYLNPLKKFVTQYLHIKFKKSPEK